MNPKEHKKMTIYIQEIRRELKMADPEAFKILKLLSYDWPESDELIYRLGVSEGDAETTTVTKEHRIKILNSISKALYIYQKSLLPSDTVKKHDAERLAVFVNGLVTNSRQDVMTQEQIEEKYRAIASDRIQFVLKRAGYETTILGFRDHTTV